MYVPPAFREERPEVLHEVIRQYSFATLVSVLDGELFATHLPFLFDAGRGEHGTLLGHMARANPHWHAFEPAPDADELSASNGSSGSSGLNSGRDGDAPESLVTFQGPHAYISPSWYEAEVAVPTWNYVAVHAYGRPRIIPDPAAVQRVLRATVNTYESAFERPWAMDGLPDRYVEGMVANVVAFEIEITRLEGKRKLSQNRPRADQMGAIAGLRHHGGPEGAALAALMDRLS
jgi:transcriptional regulator